MLCLLLLNKMFVDSSLVHDTLELLLFSYNSVVQVKGNNDDICVGERSISKNLPTITQDLSRRCITTRGESVSMYPRRPEAEVLAQRG